MAYALSSALIGTQSVVQAKCMSEIASMLISGQAEQIGNNPDPDPDPDPDPNPYPDPDPDPDPDSDPDSDPDPDPDPRL